MTATSYETLRQRHLHEAHAMLPAAIARLDWSAEQLAAERTTRLRHLVRAAQQKSAWHRQRLAHIDPETLTEAQLDTIAPMTKDDLMDHFDRIVTDPRLTLDSAEAHLAGLRGDAYLHDRYHVNASGGSSGRRGVMVHDWSGWAEGFVGFSRHLVRHIGRLGLPLPVAGAVVAAQDPMHVSSAMPQTFHDASSVLWQRFPVTLPLEHIVDGLNAAQPAVLLGYPSMLFELAFEARRGALRIAPLIVISTSEPLLPEIREAVGAAWPAMLINFWATTEALPVALSCGMGSGMHLSDDLLIVEAVDAQGRSVPPGAQADKVYLTNLYSPTPLPLIRYEISDEVSFIDEPCACGSAHRRIADIRGRLDDAFEYPGAASVHPHVFRSRLGKERHVIEYQVRQTPRGAAIAIRCNGDVDTARLRDALSGDLRRLGLSGAQIEIARVDRIERQRSGKLKRFIPLAATAVAV